MANTPLKMIIPQTQEELTKAWLVSYSPETTERSLETLRDKPIHDRVMHLVMRILFRGIYFPQLNKRAWFKVIFNNRRPLFRLVREGYGLWRASRRRLQSSHPQPGDLQTLE